MLCQCLAVAACEPLRGRDVRCCALKARSILAECECQNLRGVVGCIDIGCRLIVRHFGSVDLPEDPGDSGEKETNY